MPPRPEREPSSPSRGRRGCSAPSLSARAAPGSGREASFLQAAAGSSRSSGEYVARLDPAYLGLGGLCIGRVEGRADV